MQSGIVTEEFRCISGYINYQVSNIGRVRNSITGKILKPTLRNDGYLKVGLYFDKKQKSHLIHRLVAQEFIPNPNNLPIADHIDRSQITNNTILNLRWASNSQNGMNRVKTISNTSSKYKGVCFLKRNDKWEGYIHIDNKKINLGLFENEKDAAIKYNEKAIELFKEFALLNEISDSE